MTDFVGLIANISSLILWLPQAKITYANRKDRDALKGISYGTQIIAAINTLLWCIYGFMMHSIWLSIGTLVILPLALWTIWLKYSVDNEPCYEWNSRKLSSKTELIETEVKGTLVCILEIGLCVIIKSKERQSSWIMPLKLRLIVKSIILMW